MIVDDTQLWTGLVLKQFLSLEPEWELEKKSPPRSAIFTKVKQYAGAKWQHYKYLKESSIIHFNGPKPWEIVKNDPTGTKAKKQMKDSVLTKKWFQTAKECGTTCVFEPYLTVKHINRFS